MIGILAQNLMLYKFMGMGFNIQQHFFISSFRLDVRYFRQMRQYTETYDWFQINELEW